jgi:uncharacterized RDD family membrane protein YckC
MGETHGPSTSGGRPPDGGPESLRGRLLGTGARGARQVARATGIDNAIEVAAEETVVRAVESQVFAHALERVLSGPLIEEAVEDALTSPAVERALANALDSEMVDRIWARLLASDEAQKLVERIAEAPEVRAAVAAQGVGLLADLGRGARRAARRLDDFVESVVRRLLFRPRREQPTACAGLVTRVLALALDGAIINAGFLAVSALVVLVVSVVSGDNNGVGSAALVAGTGVWVAASAVYLLSFWALVGQTPGMRFLGIRLHAGGEPGIGLRRALRRLLGAVLAAIPLFLGYLGVMLNERRRGWQDRIAGTDVLYVREVLPTAPWSAPAGDASVHPGDNRAQPGRA